MYSVCIYQRRLAIYDSEGNELKSRAESLGGIEYGLTSQDEYIRECAQNLAHEIDYKVTA